MKCVEMRDALRDDQWFWLAEYLAMPADEMMELTGPELLNRTFRRIEERRRARMRLPVEVSDAGTHRNHGE